MRDIAARFAEQRNDHGTGAERVLNDRGTVPDVR